MSSIAVHAADSDVNPASDGDAVILIQDHGVSDNGVIARANVKAIGVVRCGQGAGEAVGRVSSRVVERDIIHVQSGGASNAEAVHRIILDVDVVDGAGAQCLYSDEVVRSALDLA
jgi:hypothetical protein